MVRSTKSKAGPSKKPTQELKGRDKAKDLKKITQGEGELAPYCLVLYKSDRKKGVVETKSISKASRNIGAECLAPLPVDCNSKQSNELYKAEVVSFGYDIDFLYDYIVNEDGTVVEEKSNENQDEALQNKAKNKIVEKQKADNIAKMNTESSMEVNVFAPLFKDSNQKHTSVHENSNVDIDDPDDVENTGNKDLLSIMDINSESSSSRETSNFIGCSLDDVTVEDIEVANDKSQPCPVLKVLAQATPENIAFMKAFTDSNMSFLKNLLEVATKHEGTSCSFSLPVDGVTETATLQNLEYKRKRTPTTLPKLKLSELDCSVQDINKYPIARGVAIFMNRFEYVSLPPIEGMIVPESQKTFDQKEIDKKKVVSKEPIAARTMGKLLLDKLVPVEIQKERTASTLPDEITTAILAYINSRLPEESRFKKSSVTEWITDRCRSHIRDRTAEAARRGGNHQRKKAKPSTVTNLQNLVPKQVMLEDGTVQTLYELQD